MLSIWATFCAGKLERVFAQTHDITWSWSSVICIYAQGRSTYAIVMQRCLPSFHSNTNAPKNFLELHKSTNNKLAHARLAELAASGQLSNTRIIIGAVLSDRLHCCVKSNYSVSFSNRWSPTFQQTLQWFASKLLVFPLLDAETTEDWGKRFQR